MDFAVGMALSTSPFAWGYFGELGTLWNDILLQTVERPLYYTMARSLTLWHPECHVWRKPPWVLLWLNENSHQRVPWCQTTLSNSQPRWCIFFLENHIGLLQPSLRGGGGAGKDKGISSSLGVGCSLGTCVASDDQLTDLCGGSWPPYRSVCPGSTLSQT